MKAYEVEVIFDQIEELYSQLPLHPFDVVRYIPTNEDGIVKSYNKKGVFVIFRIQSTAAFCRWEDIEIYK